MSGNRSVSVDINLKRTDSRNKVPKKTYGGASPWTENSILSPTQASVIDLSGVMLGVSRMSNSTVLMAPDEHELVSVARIMETLYNPMSVNLAGSVHS